VIAATIQTGAGLACSVWSDLPGWCGGTKAPLGMTRAWALPRAVNQGWPGQGSTPSSLSPGPIHSLRRGLVRFAIRAPPDGGTERSSWSRWHAGWSRGARRAGIRSSLMSPPRSSATAPSCRCRNGEAAPLLRMRQARHRFRRDRRWRPSKWEAPVLSGYSVLRVMMLRTVVHTV